MLAWMTLLLLSGLAFSSSAGSVSGPTPTADPCRPVFEPVRSTRYVSSNFVDQGLASLPHVYPRHALLAQRRQSSLGAVGFSLLVYQPDASKPDVTVEGVATHETLAWRFTARCTVESLSDGLVTTFEEIAKLSARR